MGNILSYVLTFFHKFYVFILLYLQVGFAIDERLRVTKNKHKVLQLIHSS